MSRKEKIRYFTDTIEEAKYLTGVIEFRTVGVVVTRFILSSSYHPLL